MISALFLAEGLAQLGCGIGAGIATIGAGLGIGKIGGSAMERLVAALWMPSLVSLRLLVKSRQT